MLSRVLMIAGLLAPLALHQEVRPLPPAAAAAHITPLPEEAVRLNARLARNLQPSARAKVQSAAAAITDRVKQQPAVSVAQLQANARAAALQNFPNAQGMDIDALIAATLMECSKESEAELQQEINQMQQMDARRAALRHQLAASQTPNPSLTANQLAALKASQKAMQGDLDSMNEMSEMTSMRLQMAMDRRSKFIEALSNIMKKIDSTAETITQNLK